MNIFPCKLICKYKNPPYREIVLSPYVTDFESAVKLSLKFIKENSAYSIHRCTISLVNGDERIVAEFNDTKNVFEQIQNDFEASSCS